MKEILRAQCGKSPTGVHYLMMGYDGNGSLIPIDRFPKCECCGEDIVAEGARWVARGTYMIEEELCIEDLV